jgi:hypothetical protein
VTVASACAELASAQCAGLQSCSAVLLEARYGTVAACETRTAEGCVNALGAPSTGNSASISAACARTYPTWSCADLLGNVSPSAACAQARGALNVGAPCAFAAQCATGFCAIAPSSACGTCADLPSAGDSCADLTSCGQGLVCFAGSRVCGTLGGAGSPCAAAAPCGAHLSCIGADAARGTSGVCQTSASLVGSTCDPTLATGPGCDYDDGLACDGQSKVCEPFSVSLAGGPCDTQDHELAVCGASGTCSTSAPGNTGTCSAAAADGQPCTTSGAGGPACLPPSRCIATGTGGATGTCQQDGATTCP